MDFRERAVTIERCVKRVESSVAPATVRRRAENGLAPFSRHPPDGPGERLPLEGVDRVEKLEIAGAAIRH